MNKKDIAFIIAETLVVILNIVTTWVFGASKIASTIVWLMLLCLCVLLVLISNAIEDYLHERKKYIDLINHLQEKNIGLYAEILHLNIEIKHLKKEKQDNNNPPVE